MVLKLRTEK
uniref:Uncharacterized protein n=1 Tax=Arundo donax TaxID=35708 RepID=A0A0A9BS42_ARUDO